MRALSMGDLGGAIMVLWQAGGKWNGLRRCETVRNHGREAMKRTVTDRRVFWAARSILARSMQFWIDDGKARFIGPSRGRLRREYRA